MHRLKFIESCRLQLGLHVHMPAKFASYAVNFSDNNSSHSTRLIDLLVMVGPSGSGKSSLINKLMADTEYKRYGYSISHTTRDQRPNEINGAHYYFLSIDEFNKHKTMSYNPNLSVYSSQGQEYLIKKYKNTTNVHNQVTVPFFIETARVHNTEYGTSHKSIESILGANQVACMDIDYKGALRYKQEMKQFRVLSVFISVSCMDNLAFRVRQRGSNETSDAFQTRMSNAKKEMEFFQANPHAFDACFINDNFDECYKEFSNKINSLCFT